MDKTLTISIAAYNVEKYLKQTLDSFINDSVMDDIEVLIIDDGSKDKTAEIASDYEHKYPNTFKLISKPNGGHGSTINTGIKNATGKYFKIVDGDDWVNTDNFVKLVQYLKGATSDLVATNYIEINDSTMDETPVVFNNIKYNTEYKYDDTLKLTELYMHQITLKTSILKDNGIVIDENCFYVDTEFIILPIPYINTITFIDLFIYMYRLGLVTQSVSRLGKIKHVEDHVKVTKRLSEFAGSELVKSLSTEKRLYINWFAAKLIRTTLGFYLSFPFKDKTVRKRLSSFDNDIKQINEAVYEYSKHTIRFPLDIENDEISLPEFTAGDKRINLLRKNNFFGWRTSQFFVNMIKENGK